MNFNLKNLVISGEVRTNPTDFCRMHSRIRHRCVGAVPWCCRASPTDAVKARFGRCVHAVPTPCPACVCVRATAAPASPPRVGRLARLFDARTARSDTVRCVWVAAAQYPPDRLQLASCTRIRRVKVTIRRSFAHPTRIFRTAASARFRGAVERRQPTPSRHASVGASTPSPHHVQPVCV